MKTFATCLVSFVTTLVVLSHCVAAQEKAGTDSTGYYLTNGEMSQGGCFNLGLGFVIGSSYKDELEIAYPEREWSGGGGWIYMDMGLEFTIAPRVSVGPTFGMSAVIISYENSYNLPASKEATIMFLPGIGGRYAFTDRLSTLFAAADVGLVVPVSDLEAPELGSGGVALGVSLGYTFSREFEIALMYRSVPVEVSSSTFDDWSFDTVLREETANFGGIGLVFRRAWSF